MTRGCAIPVVAILVLGPLMSACSSSGTTFDPTDWIAGDWFNSKPPLPGERKPVFPQGVPGVPEGVPKELVKGSQQTAIAEEAPPPEPAPPPKPAPKPQAAKPAAKPRTASAPPPQSQPQPTQSAPARTAPTSQPQPSGQSMLPWPDDPPPSR